jgi:hypothetical protein
MKAWVAAAVGIVVVGCGQSSSASLANSSPASSIYTASPAFSPEPSPATGVRLGSPPPFPSPITDSPVPSPGGWVTFVNHLGQFTYSAPSSWKAIACEDSGAGYVVAESGSLPCGVGEYESAWLFVISIAGDQRANYPYRGRLVSAAQVTVDGVQGFRWASHVDSPNPLPPPKGSDEITYAFFNGTRTYSFNYDRWPGEPDRSADFDRSVQQVLFTA